MESALRDFWEAKEVLARAFQLEEVLEVNALDEADFGALLESLGGPA